MPKPNPEVFAKQVLWQLSSLQADVYEIQMLVTEILARQSRQLPEKVQARWKPKSDELRQRLYSEALSAVELEPDPPTGPNQEYKDRL